MDKFEVSIPVHLRRLTGEPGGTYVSALVLEVEAKNQPDAVERVATALAIFAGCNVVTQEELIRRAMEGT